MGDDTATVVDDSGELVGCSSFEVGAEGGGGGGDEGGGSAMNDAMFFTIHQSKDDAVRPCDTHLSQLVSYHIS